MDGLVKDAARNSRCLQALFTTTAVHSTFVTTQPSWPATWLSHQGLLATPAWVQIPAQMHHAMSKALNSSARRALSEHTLVPRRCPFTLPRWRGALLTPPYYSTLRLSWWMDRVDCGRFQLYHISTRQNGTPQCINSANLSP